MRKLLIGLVILVLSVMLLIGCSGTVTPPPPDDVPPLALIREYTARDYVQRWADGEVTIVDFTEKTKEIWTEVNGIINGSVVFKMTTNPAAQIGIEYQSIDGMFYVGFPGMENNTFKKCGILIDPEVPSNLLDTVCMYTILIAVGINNPEKWDEGFSQEMKNVLYWLYRLEPGYPLS